MLGVWFSIAAVWVSLAIGWMAARDIRSMAEVSPLGIQSGVFFDAIPVCRILLSGPLVIWAVAIAMRMFGGRCTKNDQEPSERTVESETL